jgi:peptide-methionine (R)-S-oxide reductase
MLTRRFFMTNSVIGLATWLGTPRFVTNSAAAEAFRVAHADAEWGMLLTPDQYAVLRQSATERPFTSPLLNEHRPGVFACAGCDLGLFSSETKFESGTGWPSFWAPLNEQVVDTTRDTALGMIRVEVHCSRCGGHLGHVFNDGPKVTGLRYCMNGVAMTFKPAAT